MLVDDVEKINWGVIQVGSYTQKIEGKECCDAFVLNHMERYPSGYAAHSYIINKPSAQKLIDNNTPNQFAADVNIHCSDIELYCTPISHFGQKTGDYFRWDTAKMVMQFEEHVLFEMGKHGNEFLSHTTHGDDYYEEDYYEDEALNKPIAEQTGLTNAEDDDLPDFVPKVKEHDDDEYDY